MNKIRITVGEIFQSPLQNLSFVQYMANVNTAGKITAKSLMDLVTVLFTYAEEQEKKNEQYEANFREIEAILSKLVEQKVEAKTPDVPNGPMYSCDECDKTAKSELGLLSHKRSHLPKKEV